MILSASGLLGALSSVTPDFVKIHLIVIIGKRGASVPVNTKKVTNPPQPRVKDNIAGRAHGSPKPNSSSTQLRLC